MYSADNEIGLVGIMDELEKKYQKDWKRSTVCTFIAHLIEKGYVNGRREGRVFYYSSAINDKKFLEAQVKQFMTDLSKNWCSMHAWLKEFQRRMQLRL